jgi:hypothetical protein
MAEYHAKLQHTLESGCDIVDPLLHDKGVPSGTKSKELKALGKEALGLNRLISCVPHALLCIKGEAWSPIEGIQNIDNRTQLIGKSISSK